MEDMTGCEEGKESMVKEKEDSGKSKEEKW